MSEFEVFKKQVMHEKEQKELLLAQKRAETELGHAKLQNFFNGLYEELVEKQVPMQHFRYEEAGSTESKLVKKRTWFSGAVYEYEHTSGLVVIDEWGWELYFQKPQSGRDGSIALEQIYINEEGTARLITECWQPNLRYEVSTEISEIYDFLSGKSYSGRTLTDPHEKILTVLRPKIESLLF